FFYFLFSKLFESFFPKKFCREYAEIQGGGAPLAIFMAAVLGLKPAHDLWIKKKDSPIFKKICRKYRLFCETDLASQNRFNLNLTKAVGGKTLTTTIAQGLWPELADPGDKIHIFISRTKKGLKEAFGPGWYPLVINGRVFNKPYFDHIRFGRALGYPECCVKFFRRFNDWNHYSFLYEIYKNTKGKPRYLANCLIKNTPYSYIYHMPCSFDCRKTIAWVEKIREAVLKKEPDYVRRIDKHLKLPCLVFEVRIIYTFEGELKNNHLFYRKVYPGGVVSNFDFYGKILARGDNLLVKNDDVHIFKGQRLFKIIKSQKNKKPIRIPFLIQFQ
ncbi:MAG: DUF483 domain-containing protein, partial [bacterium]|nr:DUF483 domain-containing protein [bacterium]